MDYPKHQIEVIVVDNGSTDSTVEIARQYGAHVFVEPTGTVAQLRNIGAQESSGDLLAFVDADCAVAKGWLQCAVQYFEMPEVVAWGSPPEPPSPATWVQASWYKIRQKTAKAAPVDWLESMNLFVRRDEFLSLSGFEQSLVTCEDVDLCYRLGKEGRIICDPKIRVIHFGEAASIPEFIRKEYWRGSSNLTGLWSHGWSLKELPSVLVPLIYLLLLPILIGLPFWISFPLSLLLVLSLILALTLLALIKVSSRCQIGLRDAASIAGILQVYFVARAISLIRRPA